MQTNIAVLTKLTEITLFRHFKREKMNKTEQN